MRASSDSDARYYIYALCLSDCVTPFYIGCCTDIDRRIKEHFQAARCPLYRDYIHFQKILDHWDYTNRTLPHRVFASTNDFQLACKIERFLIYTNANFLTNVQYRKRQGRFDRTGKMGDPQPRHFEGGTLVY